KEKPDVVKSVSSEEIIEREELASEAKERVREETEIEGKEKPDVIDKVIKKVVIDKQEVPEVVKSVIKKAVVEDKELPDGVETAIKSTLEKKEGGRREEAPLSSSAENVVNQLSNISTQRDKAIIKSFLSEKRPLLHAWNTLSTKINDKLGLNLGLAYTSLYQYAPDVNGTRDAASGDLDIFGTWSLWNKNGNHPGSIGFQTEYRHRYTSITPSDLSDKAGSLWKTIRGFNRRDFSLVEMWWEQHIQKDTLSFRIGKLNIKNFFNNYKFQSSNNYFFNAALSDSPAIAFPENAGGLVLAYQPTKESYIIAGIADADGKKTSLDNTFFLTASNFFYAIEFGVKPKPNNFGKGSYSLTLWHSEERDEDDLPSDEGFSLSLEQELTDKVTPFVRYSYSDGDATQIQQLISTGVGFVDTFGREKDVAGIGLAWGDPADKSLQDQYTVDTFYRFQYMEHIQITPGFQLMVNPSNDRDNDVETIFQIRARITF
ncbi:MAG: carbohydrate porin, partial [Candidatus Brocadiaceae bacterium]|nr:carbohydrate porin [Candidatus Brocadiaceae bacterium]